MRRPPVWLGGILCAALAAAGWSGAQAVGESPYTDTDTVTTTTAGRVTTRVVRRVARARVVTLAGGTRVVSVPVLTVRVDHTTIRVPAQTLPFTRGAPGGPGLTAAVAVPVTVTVYVPVTSYLPTVVTSVTTTTETILSTITIPGLPGPEG